MATFTGTNASEILPSLVLGTVQALGNDQIYGLGGDDILIGWTGNDILEGGTGADTLIGGIVDVKGTVGDINVSGLDTASYASSAAGVSVDLSVTSLVDVKIGNVNVGLTSASAGHGGDAEGDILIGMTNLTGSQHNDTLRGNADDNVLLGLGGNDILDGGAGADRMEGGLGSDTYYVDNKDDVVVELANGGSDTVYTSVSYSLAWTSEVEGLRASPGTTTGLVLVGNPFAQTMSGGDGNDTLDGNRGIDTMAGGRGDDVYVVDNSDDIVIEAANQGLDSVFASANYILRTGVSVERLSTTNPLGTADLALTGNELAQVVRGNAGANIINGRSGNDTLFGGAGNDTFVFDRPLGAPNLDRIMDFAPGSDKIELSDDVFTKLAPGALSAAAFHEGFAAADSSDRIIYDHTTGRLFYDPDGVGGASQMQFASVQTDLALTNADFFIA